jgi:hypothetical protein
MTVRRRPNCDEDHILGADPQAACSMNEKQLRARIDRVVSEKERTYGRLLELRDQLDAIVGELDRAALSPTAGLPNISNIVALPSRFRGSKP